MIGLTKWFMPLADALAGSENELDREFAGHLKLVFNQALQRLRETGFSAETAEKVGKLLWRLYNVFQAYKAKGREFTGAEWIAKLAGLADELAES